MALIAYDSTGTPRQPRGVFHGQQAAQDQIADLRQQLEQSSDCFQVAILSSGQWQQRAAELAERQRDELAELLGVQPTCPECSGTGKEPT